MNQDDDMRNDGQDDETPEEMVNRSLAEALENQQRYMDMFQNSAHMLQVISRFMSDPIVVHDLEAVSDDGTSSSITPSSSSSPLSPTLSSQTLKDNDVDEPVVSYRIFGGCTNTVTLRSGRLRSAMPRRTGRYIQDNESSVDPAPRVDTGQGNNPSSCQPNDCPGDHASPKSLETTAGSLVSTSCQTQSSTTSKTNVGVGNINATQLETGSNHQSSSSIGVSTQTSINNAMSEISKAADTIRRARTMLNSLNIGSSSRAVNRQQMNNNNRKEVTGSDKDIDVTDDSEQKEQCDVDSKQNEQRSSDSTEKSMADGNADGKIKSIFVNVKPSSDDASRSVSNGAEGSSSVETNDYGKLTARKATVLSPNNAGDVAQSDRVGSDFNTCHKRRQKTTVTAGIAGASYSPIHSVSSHNMTNLIDVQSDSVKTPKYYAFETSSIQKLNALCPRTKPDDLIVTIEMFQSALNTAIENLEKDGIWSAQTASNLKSNRVNVNNLLESKINGNFFTLPSQDECSSRKAFLQTPCCTSRSCSSSDTSSSKNASEMTLYPSPAMEDIHTSVVVFDSVDIPSSGHELPRSSSNSNTEDTYKREQRESDIESTFGQCSSIHLSPVMAFNVDENTDDEAVTLVPEENTHANSRKSEPDEHSTQIQPSKPENTKVTTGDSCPAHVRSQKTQKHLDKAGGGDSVSPLNNRNEGNVACPVRKPSTHSGVINCEDNQSAMPQQREKPGFFRRLTSAIKVCSFKKK